MLGVSGSRRWLGQRLSMDGFMALSGCYGLG